MGLFLAALLAFSTLVQAAPAGTPAPAPPAGMNASVYGVNLMAVIAVVLIGFLSFFMVGSVGKNVYVYGYFLILFAAALGFGEMFPPMVIISLAIGLLFAYMAFMGFTSMMQVTGHDRYEGDSNNYGRVASRLQ